IFKKTCHKLIEIRKQWLKENPNNKDKNLLDLLLEHQTKKGENAMTDNEILNEFIAFFVAGMDTTGHLVTMMSYNLHNNQECLKEVEQEVTNVYGGKPIDNITMENLN